jgi:hypothetical protein
LVRRNRAAQQTKGVEVIEGMSLTLVDHLDDLDTLDYLALP